MFQMNLDKKAQSGYGKLNVGASSFNLEDEPKAQKVKLSYGIGCKPIVDNKDIDYTHYKDLQKILEDSPKVSGKYQPANDLYHVEGEDLDEEEEEYIYKNFPNL